MRPKTIGAHQVIVERSVGCASSGCAGIARSRYTCPRHSYAAYTSQTTKKSGSAPIGTSHVDDVATFVFRVERARNDGSGKLFHVW